LGFTGREVKEDKEIAMATPVVLITAALSGIGRAAAFAFERAGSRLIVSGRRPDAGEASADELRSLGGEAEFIQANVTSEHEARRHAHEIADAILFVASDKASNITSQIIRVNGGKTAS
jgi:NAD(P)-dependent dehydrogenase (short-subunit alcohol dehydrogenase family)